MRKWSEDRKATLKTMWLEGSTSRQISEALGDVTRNAVMGMVDRMGLMRSEEHASRSTARMAGCCSAGWVRGSSKVEADVSTAVGATPVVGDLVPSVDSRDVPVEVVAVEVVAVEVVPVEMPVTEPATVEVSHVDPVEIQAVEVDAILVDAVPVESVVVDAIQTDAAPAEAVAVSVVEVAANDRSVAEVETAAPVAPSPEEAPDTEVDPVDDPAEDLPWIVDPSDDDAVHMPQERPLLDDIDEPVDEDEDDLEPVSAKPTAAEVAAKIDRLRAAPAKRPPSPRAWRPRMLESKMPLGKKDVPPPPEVVISSGVMSALTTLQPGASQPQDAFTLLRDLTGVPYDDRVPGHGAALVAIATVLVRGDPRSVLSPRIPEQSVLRFMRRFAEKGIVVAGKPPARWVENVDDRVFYDEMVQIAA